MIYNIFCSLIVAKLKSELNNNVSVRLTVGQCKCLETLVLNECSLRQQCSHVYPFLQTVAWGGGGRGRGSHLFPFLFYLMYFYIMAIRRLPVPSI
jgi:hypothetical protein